MDISIKSSNLTTSYVTKLPYRRLKSTCTKNCVPARNPLGYVENYAPALACKLRLLASPKGYAKTRVLHHI
jgi:hypothetical protein